MLRAFFRGVIATVVIKIPSKTFAIGEYGVLKNGSAIVLTCKPYFKLEVHKGQNQNLPEGIHPKSIAGKFYEKTSEKYKGLSLRFIDPYKGSGGMGRSSAEFLSLYALAYGIPFEVTKVREVFRNLHESGHLLPSGVDLVAQSIGGVAVINLSKNQWTSKKWILKDIGFFIVSTGEKIITHSHLETLKEDAFTELIEISNLSICAYERLDTRGFTQTVNVGLNDYVRAFYKPLDEQGFIQTLRDYNAILWEKGLLSQTSRKLCLELEKVSSVLAAKGCGAMGADTVLVLFYTKDRDSLRNYIEGTLNRTIVATDRDIGRGIYQEN